MPFSTRKATVPCSTGQKGMKTLSHLLTEPVRYREAPEMFCLGLFPEFDLERLGFLARPTPVEQRFLEASSGDWRSSDQASST